MNRTWIKWAFPYLVVVVVLVLTISNGNKIEELTEQTSELTCSMARLVSFVPAVQFEGEPKDNFVGWIVARHDMLNVVEDGTCSEDTLYALSERVRLDERLLEDIGVNPDDVFTPSD